MRVFPLIAGATLALSACSGGSETVSNSNELVVDTLTAQNLVIEDSAPLAANAVDESSPPAAAEPPPTAAARTARTGEAPRSTPEATRPRDAPSKTEPSPEPASDPHAGHDMNNMSSN